MKILKYDIDAKGGGGSIKFVAEEGDDMYHLYNIVARGDFIAGSTVRNVS